MSFLQKLSDFTFLFINSLQYYDLYILRKQFIKTVFYNNTDRFIKYTLWNMCIIWKIHKI